MSKSYEAIEVEECVRVTGKAALLRIDDEEHWIPFSNIEDNGDELDEEFSGTLWLTTWICDQRGIEY